MQSGSVAVGVDLGGTNLKVALVDAAGDILAKTSLPTGAERGPESVVRDAAEAIETLLKLGSIKLTSVAGLGIAAPGPMSMRAGRITRTANLPGWRDVPLRDLFTARCGVRAILENDGNAAAYGEYWTAGGNGGDLVLLTLGTGVGAGVILGGRVFHGYFENAAEIGHTIAVINGLPCPCGQRGCLEQYASAAGLARRVIAAVRSGETSEAGDAVRQAPESLTAEQIVAWSTAGDALCRRVFDEACLHLAVACINIQHTYNPRVVLLGGGMSAAGACLLEGVRGHLAAQRWSLHEDIPEVALARLGNDAGVIGAAGLIWGLGRTSKMGETGNG